MGRSQRRCLRRIQRARCWLLGEDCHETSAKLDQRIGQVREAEEQDRGEGKQGCQQRVEKADFEAWRQNKRDIADARRAAAKEAKKEAKAEAKAIKEEQRRKDEKNENWRMRTKRCSPS